MLSKVEKGEIWVGKLAELPVFSAKSIRPRDHHGNGVMIFLFMQTPLSKIKDALRINAKK